MRRQLWREVGFPNNILYATQKTSHLWNFIYVDIFLLFPALRCYITVVGLIILHYASHCYSVSKPNFPLIFPITSSIWCILESMTANALKTEIVLKFIKFGIFHHNSVLQSKCGFLQNFMWLLHPGLSPLVYVLSEWWCMSHKSSLKSNNFTGRKSICLPLILFTIM